MSTMTAPLPGTRTISVNTDDPFNSLYNPPAQPAPAPSRKAAAFGKAPIRPGNKAQTFLRPDVEPTFNDPLLKKPSALQTAFVPKEEYIQARRSARDAWFAVMILAAFFVGGIYWIVSRVGADAVKIEDLTAQVTSLNEQLTSERSVVIARNQELKLVNEQLADERKRLRRR